MLTFLQIQNSESEQLDSAELKAFIQAHVPGAHLKEAQGGDMVYSLPPFTSSNASSYRSLLTALDANLDDLQLGGYGISDTTLEEVSECSPTLKSSGLVTILATLLEKNINLHMNVFLSTFFQNWQNCINVGFPPLG